MTTASLTLETMASALNPSQPKENTKILSFTHLPSMESEELSDEEARLASRTVLAWAVLACVSGKFAKDWIRKRKINAAQVQRLKNANV